MLVLTLKIGERLYIKPIVSGCVVVEVLNVITDRFGERRIKLEIIKNKSKKNHLNPYLIECSQQVQASPAEQGIEEVGND